MERGRVCDRSSAEQNASKLNRYQGRSDAMRIALHCGEGRYEIGLIDLPVRVTSCLYPSAKDLEMLTAVVWTRLTTSETAQMMEQISAQPILV